MKKTEEWLQEMGAAVGLDMFAGGNPPGCRTEKVIDAIQLDARKQGMQDAVDLFMADCIPLSSREQGNLMHSRDAAERIRIAMKANLK